MNGKKSEYVESKGMNSKDNGRKRSNVKHSRQRLIAKRGRIQARITRKHIHPSLSPRFPIASFPLCRALPFTSPPRKRVTCTQRAYHGQDDTTEVRRRLRLRYVCVYHRETGWSVRSWTMVHHRLGLVWYTRKASLCTAARPGKPPPRDRTAYNPSTLAPPLPFTPSPTASALSPSYPRRYASPLRLAHATDAFRDGGSRVQALLPANREGALGAKVLIDDIARKLGGTTPF